LKKNEAYHGRLPPAFFLPNRTRFGQERFFSFSVLQVFFLDVKGLPGVQAQRHLAYTEPDQLVIFLPGDFSDPKAEGT